MLYFIEQRDFDSAKQYINEEDPYQLMLFHAYKGDKVAAKKFADESGLVEDKIELYAIFNEPDSLFYYLDRTDGNVAWINKEPFMDPYRKDPRYIAFREKHYLEDVSIE